jgi:hypothetical protein
LGRVYLTQKDFPKAEAKLLEVTTMGYSLLPNYNDLFDYTKNEHHSEYIFDIEYEEGRGKETDSRTHLLLTANLSLLFMELAEMETNKIPPPRG